ncbi:hypothetical protein IJJ18_02745 [Candidatus Saccharibacteria bacterium]|nr:hypothetical protein [Candidatus Saccharibacteria bacterium]
MTVASSAVEPTRNSLVNLLNYLETAYPNFRFKVGNRFKFCYPNQISLENPENSAIPPAFFALQTLHELGHALCKHKDYNTDVSRLKIERAAWEAAKTAYEKLPDDLRNTFKWDKDYVEDSLDTYRDWLHKKSTCKTCGLTCYQTPDGKWHCPRCENFI